MARQNLTLQRIKNAKCPVGKKQVFLWDEKARGLGIRVTNGAKVFIFQGRLGVGKDAQYIRIKIADVTTHTIEDARNRSRELALLIAQGIDPREEKKRITAREAANRKESKRQNIVVADVWAIYIEDRKSSWSEKYYLDHIRLVHPGGKEKKRGKGKTVPGTLAAVIKLQLSEINAEIIKTWLGKETKVRPTQARIAFEAFRTFLNWCEGQTLYKGIASPNACSARIKKDNIPKKKAKNDCLQKEQLSVWFQAVLAYPNKIMSAYFQVLLLTGRRREEILSLKWSYIDFKWNSLEVEPKGGGGRTKIPLTPYVSSLLSALPKRNKWVFSSLRAANGRLQSPTKAHKAILQTTSIEDLTPHGLRRSFGTLSEWLEIPVGIVYQIQGHRPSATAEKHYRERPLDLLRMWHTKLEVWILEQAGLGQVKKALPST